MAGILIHQGFSSGLTGIRSRSLPWIWLLAGVAAGAGTFAGPIRSRLGPRGLAVLASFCFLCLGAIRLPCFETAGPLDIRHLVGSERVLATIQGRILTRPCQQRRDWLFAQFSSTDPTTSFYLTMEGIETPDGWRAVEGVVRVRVDEPAPNLQVGDCVQAYCWLHRYEEPTNPGQFNTARYLRLRNVYVGASVPSREAVTVLDGPPPGILIGLRKTLADATTRALLDHPPSDTQDEAILEALLLGERRNIDPGTYEAFRRTGLLHLVSLSGMHLCILIGIVWWFGKLAGLLKTGRAAVCVVATMVFLLVVPSRAPTLRAAVIVWAFCASILLRRRANPLNSLSLAAIVLLLIQPTQIFDAGWQLSFAATTGIIAFASGIEQWLRDRAIARLESPIPGLAAVLRVLKAMANAVVRPLSVGLAAWLGSAGILLYHFYNVTPLASVWTMIAALPVTGILTVGFVKIVLAFLLPTLSVLLGYVLSVLADLLIWMVRLMAEVDSSYILIGCVPLSLVLLYYAMILFAAFVRLRRPIVKKALCMGMLFVLLASLGMMKWRRTHRDHLSVTCLDVGHGQSILARFPGMMNVLFDSGSLYVSDIGARIVVPFLDHEGIDRLHAVIVSHRDIDHINGLPEVVDRRPVDCVYFDDTSFTRSQDVETVQALMDHLAARQIRMEHAPEIVDAGRTQIRILWPTSETTAQEQCSDNDKSLVCLLEYAGRKVLLCSDIEQSAQRRIMSLYATLEADVVVVPHHGSVKTLDSRFLEHVGPRVLICSCGTTDYEQGRVIRAPAIGQLLVTARDGAIDACIGSNGMIRTTPLKQY